MEEATGIMTRYGGLTEFSCRCCPFSLDSHCLCFLHIQLLCHEVNCLNDVCGMGGVENKDGGNQWYRFITPIFLHIGKKCMLQDVYSQYSNVIPAKVNHCTLFLYASLVCGWGVEVWRSHGKTRYFIFTCIIVVVVVVVVCVFFLWWWLGGGGGGFLQRGRETNY